MLAIKKCQSECTQLDKSWTCHRYHYSSASNLYSLRSHIQNHYEQEYLSHVPHDWANLLPAHRAEQALLTK